MHKRSDKHRRARLQENSGVSTAQHRDRLTRLGARFRWLLSCVLVAAVSQSALSRIETNLAALTAATERNIQACSTQPPTHHQPTQPQPQPQPSTLTPPRSAPGMSSYGAGTRHLSPQQQQQQAHAHAAYQRAEDEAAAYAQGAGNGLAGPGLPLDNNAPLDASLSSNYLSRRYQRSMAGAGGQQQPPQQPQQQPIYADRSNAFYAQQPPQQQQQPTLADFPIHSETDYKLEALQLMVTSFKVSVCVWSEAIRSISLYCAASTAHLIHV